MLKEKVFEDLNARLSQLIANSPARDLEKNARALLSGVFTRLDLVTRQEFDVQSEVLRRTREKLEQLEAKLVALENRTVGGPGNRGSQNLSGVAPETSKGGRPENPIGVAPENGEGVPPEDRTAAGRDTPGSSEPNR